jgi:hypothetical protein
VDEAFSTGAFFLLVGAFVKAHFGVIHELFAFDAEFFAFCVMVILAVDVHHCVDGFLFSCYSGMLSQGSTSLGAITLVTDKISVA